MRPPRQLELPDPPSAPADMQGWLRETMRRLREWSRDVRASLAGGITLGESLHADVRTVQLITSELPITLDTRFSAPLTVLVLAARVVDGDGTTIGSLDVQWRGNPTGGIRIVDVLGLSPATRYEVTFLVVGG